MPAETFNLNNFINIGTNSIKRLDFFRNLSGKKLVWSVGVHCL